MIGISRRISEHYHVAGHLMAGVNVRQTVKVLTTCSFRPRLRVMCIMHVYLRYLAAAGCPVDHLIAPPLPISIPTESIPSRPNPVIMSVSQTVDLPIGVL